MRIVVAVGGSGLPGFDADGPGGRPLVRLAADLAEVAAHHELVVALGRSPAAGWLSLEPADEGEPAELPLGLLDHQVSDLEGRELERELANHLAAGTTVVSVLTNTLVARDDPAFERADVRVGPVVGPLDARRLAVRHGWQFAGSGRAWRRVVPGPAPRAVQPVEPVRALLGLGHVVVCAGGGGVPVLAGTDGLERVPAVVDADATTAVLAEQLEADLLVLATDVDAVYDDWATPRARPVAAIERRAAADGYAAGSMRPKVRAGQQFARTGRPAVIGAVDDLPRLVEGRAGTLLTPSPVAGVVDAARPGAAAPPLRPARRAPR